MSSSLNGGMLNISCWENYTVLAGTSSSTMTTAWHRGLAQTWSLSFEYSPMQLDSVRSCKNCGECGQTNHFE